MDYELAKKLKDAGFPQKHHKTFTNGLIEDETLVPYVPTLSELIEACGEGLNNLWRFDKDWMANFRMLPGNLNQSEWDSIGKTPEEAVANLWLKLNE